MIERNAFLDMNLLPKHYDKISGWLERLGLAIIVGMVFQKFLDGEYLGEFGVSISLVSALIIYIIAFLVLKRS
jgi:hypothetical protein